jgi:hypothetical protein
VSWSGSVVESLLYSDEVTCPNPSYLTLNSARIWSLGCTLMSSHKRCPSLKLAVR